mmetsp:Transcript_62027/g.96364  ORF Transcript_62027/g.96364 Transcript_62027/m.96364 type:complete len:213 (-) Transcript_62027:692-1330(-)
MLSLRAKKKTTRYVKACLILPCSCKLRLKPRQRKILCRTKQPQENAKVGVKRCQLRGLANANGRTARVAQHVDSPSQLKKNQVSNKQTGMTNKQPQEDAKDGVKKCHLTGQQSVRGRIAQVADLVESAKNGVRNHHFHGQQSVGGRSFAMVAHLAVDLHPHLLQHLHRHLLRHHLRLHLLLHPHLLQMELQAGRPDLKAHRVKSQRLSLTVF